MQAFLVPCWWVGWWLWRAGCISQDTYLLYYNYGKTVPNQVIVCKCSGVEDKVAYKERGWYSPPLTGKTLGRPSTKIFSGYCPVRLGTEFIKNTPLLSWTQCHNSGSKRMKNENNNYYNITLFPSLPRVTHSGHIRVIFCVLPVHHSFTLSVWVQSIRTPVGTSQGQDVHQDFSGQTNSADLTRTQKIFKLDYKEAIIKLLC